MEDEKNDGVCAKGDDCCKAEGNSPADKSDSEKEGSCCGGGCSS